MIDHVALVGLVLVLSWAVIEMVRGPTRRRCPVCSGKREPVDDVTYQRYVEQFHSDADASGEDVYAPEPKS